MAAPAVCRLSFAPHCSPISLNRPYGIIRIMETLIEQAKSLLEGETDRIANAANLSALLYHSLEDINWAGFYFLQGNELVLGPFQGKPACVRIPLGKGVCGTAALQKKTLIVPDVHQFQGHIACDAASNAEIVIPLIIHQQLIGVLDIDSTRFGRFSDQDRITLETIAELYVKKESD
jgi:L-methionine (R)-S-oxide reductase